MPAPSDERVEAPRRNVLAAVAATLVGAFVGLAPLAAGVDALALGAVTLAYYYLRGFGFLEGDHFARPGEETLLLVLKHALVQEYIPFMIYLFSLYTISGGLCAQGDVPATPLTNTAILALGTLIASFIGTTGASRAIASAAAITAALAADGALTAIEYHPDGTASVRYQTGVDKIFVLDSSLPVASMIFDVAEFYRYPWASIFEAFKSSMPSPGNTVPKVTQALVQFGEQVGELNVNRCSGPAHQKRDLERQTGLVRGEPQRAEDYQRKRDRA